MFREEEKTITAGEERLFGFATPRSSMGKRSPPFTTQTTEGMQVLEKVQGRVSGRGKWD